MSEVEVFGDGPGRGASGVVSSDAVVPSAGGGFARGGISAAATPAAGGRVVPQLGVSKLPSSARATAHRSVTIVPQTSGTSTKRWFWQVFREFAAVTDALFVRTKKTVAISSRFMVAELKWLTLMA